MAQQTRNILRYSESVLLQKGVPYSGGSFSLGNVIQVKTAGVRLILNHNGLAFSIGFDDTWYIDPGTNYTFTEDCLVVFATMVEVVL